MPCFADFVTVVFFMVIDPARAALGSISMPYDLPSATAVFQKATDTASFVPKFPR